MIDVVLALGFVAAAWAGWRQGLVRQAVGLGILVGALVAAVYLRGVAVPVVELVLADAEPGIVELAAGTLVFVAVLVIGNLVAGRLYHFVPLSGASTSVDSALGAVFSVGLRAVELSVLLILVDAAAHVAEGSPIGGLGMLDAATSLFEGSVIADLLRTTVVPVVLSVVSPFVPDAYRTLLELSAP